MEKRILKKIGIVVFFYSLLVFSGGVIGFAMKQSIPSLIAGGFFGLSLLFASVKILTFKKWGLYLSFGLLLLLDTFFSYRYISTHAFFPAGAMLLLTTTTLAILILQLRKLKAQSVP